ncbi:unnamed protein product [Sphagnum balticum]
MSATRRRRLTTHYHETRTIKTNIPSGGSLGSWVDEKRSQLRDLMRIADTLSIDILNAHGGIGVSIPMPRLFEGCTSNEGQLPVVGCLHSCNDWANATLG